MATAPTTMDYQTYLRFYGLPATAANALAWLKSGHAPMGTAIPHALQGQMGGATTVLSPSGTYNVPLAAGQQATPFTPLSFTTSPAVPAGTLPVPQNAYLPQLAQILGQAGLLSTTYNNQRQAAAAQAASQLQGSGLVDFGSHPGTPTVLQTPNGGQLQYDYTQAVGSTPNAFSPNTPDIKYGMVQGADGRAYLQAFTGVAHGSASRGVFSGSQVDQQQAQARQGLDTQRLNAYNNLEANQNSLIGQEQGALGSLQSNWANYMSKAASDAANTEAGWQATPSVPATTSTTGLSSQPAQTAPTNPSPLTQMSGGQRMVTGAAGKTGKSLARTTGQIGTAAIGGGKSIFSGAKGLTVKKLGG